MELKPILNKVIVKVEEVETIHKKVSYDASGESVETLRSRTIRFAFSDGSEHEVSLRCD